MSNTYKIRLARVDDRNQIREMIRQSVAKEKKCLDPSLIHPNFIEEFVDKVIATGNMLVVENNRLELEMIGEIHDYLTSKNPDSGIKEFSFISRCISDDCSSEADLVTWLFFEIQNKHKDVYRVELTMPVRRSSTFDQYKAMGLTVEGNYTGRLKAGFSDNCPIVPLSWINPSFN
jgi:hypothetical protein